MVEQRMIGTFAGWYVSADGAADEEPRCVISVAARMVGVHAQTLRYYERIGLLGPARSRGNIRLFSPEDVRRARWIRSLIDDLGINLAGVEVIMRMQARMADLERQVRALEDRVKSERRLRHGIEE